jgi:hypothetical protein
MDFRSAFGNQRLSGGKTPGILKATESETLYLVGDIIDGWQLKRRWYWGSDS